MFGGQTVIFVTITEDLNNRDRYNNPLEVRTETPVSGCRFRPLKASEKIEQGLNTLKDPWKLTAPPKSAVLSATSTSEIKYDGKTYPIVGGARVYPDMDGRPYKCTIFVERWEG